MRTQLLIAMAVFLNLVVATRSAAGGGLDAYIPVSPTVEATESSPIPESKFPSSDPFQATCNEHVAQEQKCIREYVEGRADETAYEECTQRALSTKNLCINGADQVASAR